MLPGCRTASHTCAAGGLEYLEVERRRYLASCVVPTLLRSYQTALTQYLRFCKQVGVDPYLLQAHLLESFATSLASRVGYKTIKSYLYGIQFHGVMRGHHQPIHDMLRMSCVAFVTHRDCVISDPNEDPSPSDTYAPCTHILITGSASRMRLC